MNKKVLVTALSTALVGAFTLSASAFTWIGLGYVFLNVNGGGSVSYDAPDVGDAGATDFVGLTVTITSGQSILLGGRVRTNEGNGTGNGADNASLRYGVDVAPGSNVNLPFGANTFDNDIWSAAAATEIGSGLAVGTHTLTVFWFAQDSGNSNTQYQSNGGGNYTATIVVNAGGGGGGGVPEPGSLGLMAIAGVIITSLRRKMLSA